MTWSIYNKNTYRPVREGIKDALIESVMDQQPQALCEHLVAVPDDMGIERYQYLTESHAGSYRRLLLPVISVDEYLPANEGSSNVVVGVYVTGEPNAILPFRDIAQHCSGTTNIVYGVSDRYPDASVVYIEYLRDDIITSHIDELIRLIVLLTGLNLEDIKVKFPIGTEEHPYSQELVNAYVLKSNLSATESALSHAIKNLDADSIEAEVHREDNL